MYWKISIPFFLFASILALSCSPSGVEENNSADGIIYYDYYSLSPGPTSPVNDTIETNRVCYNMNTKNVVWVKKNEVQIPMNFPRINSNPFALIYAHSYSFSNFNVRIAPAHTGNHWNGPTNGIYFQKIDKASGALLMSTQIINPAEYNANSVYSISEVVSDGQNLFFACNNGFVYCYSSDGVLKWKKGTYTLSSTWINYGGYGLLYYHEGKIYFNADAPAPVTGSFLYCLDAPTGNITWGRFGPNFINGRQIAFGKNHLAAFDYLGQSSVFRKSDGFELAGNSGSGTGNSFIIPIGGTDDTHLIYSNRSGDIGYIDTDHPQQVRSLDIPPIINSDFIYRDGKIYTFYQDNPPSGSFNLACIDPNNGVVWNKNMDNIVAPPYGGVYSLDYIAKGNKIYFLSCHLAAAYKTTFVITVVDINNGTVLRKYTGLPGGHSSFQRVYNIILE